MTMSEMPNLPDVTGCACFSSPASEGIGCCCGASERVLRFHLAKSPVVAPMTPEQREWCLDEIESVEGYRRSDYETCNDAGLARGVLDAWRDYCRDKGLL